MSEYQNKAVQLLEARHGFEDSNDLENSRERFLHSALELFRALGGTQNAAAAQFQKAFSTPAGATADTIGDVMAAVAAISNIQDLDMMQAAYNVLDAGWREIEADLPVRMRAR
ncbi:MAG: hypothetical protein RLZZ444_131 [Pseudomonadota bacterium]|jgi:NTP pyrophosphatase (non-canonical NTP hydrolase)